MSLLDLTDLKFQKCLFTVSLFFICIQFLQSPHIFAVFLIGLSDRFLCRTYLFSSICVQDLQLFLLIQKRLMLMLTVYVQKTFCRRLHLAYCTGFAIDLINASSIHNLP